MLEPRQLGVEELRPAAAADQQHLVGAERAGDDEVLVGSLDQARLADLGPAQAVGRSLGGPQHPAVPVDPRAPVGAEDDRQQLDQPVGGAVGVGGEVLDRLEVEEHVAAGGVAVDPQHLHAVELDAGRDDRVGHRAVDHLEEHVVDGRAVVALLDDLDRLDVAAGLTDRGRQPTQRPGDVGEADTEQVRHGSRLSGRC